MKLIDFLKDNLITLILIIFALITIEITFNDILI